MSSASTPILTSHLLILLVLFTPLLLKPSRSNINQIINKTTTAVKTAFFISLFPLCAFISQGAEAITTVHTLASFPTINLHLSFKVDFYSLIFSTVAFYVSWAITEFSLWYILPYPLKDRFFKCLLTFLITIIILVTANNLFQLFIGWEGVGIISFLLIGWWYGRADANVAALQAVLYNRIGDVGIIVALVWITTNTNSWDIPVLFSVANTINLSPILMGLILAATGKSAQFGLHPWLPSAIEGPTPVSALLHSSTIVVAGIFLLIRFSPLFEKAPLALTTCLCLGAITTLFTAYCALTQNDIKKIVAFSTSSQLGLIIVTIGLNQPQLAFFHVCTHAFFKAILFLCAGVIIHALNDEQDIRKIGGIYRTAPLTSSCLTIGSLALTGVPFLSGFFSKDAILEAVNTSYLNAGALALTLVATAFTAVYSCRIIFYVVIGRPRISPATSFNENIRFLVHPLKRLAWGSLFAGFLIIKNTLPNKTPAIVIPLIIKIAALLLTIIGVLIALRLAALTSKQFKYKPYKSAYHHFPNELGGYPLIIHMLFPKWVLYFGQTLSRFILDQTWFEIFMPKSLSKTAISSASAIEALQKGIVKIFLYLFFISAITIILFLYLLFK